MILVEYYTNFHATKIKKKTIPLNGMHTFSIDFNAEWGWEEKKH
jgi:hypothetical protein